ncbi:MAG: C_GCAxxG_C_C family protein [Candidatus Aminicenantes bacterium]|nr:C_GCAxxG_C_C family protein [Candidatus Aminicenantes bacterium]
MNSRSDEAVAMMVAGFNCAQSVFGVFCADLGLDQKTALKLATGFGAGLANKQEICGAVSGGIMAIGLKHGRTQTSDLEAKERTYLLANELMARFKVKFGSCLCRELLPGINLVTAAGHTRYKEKNLAETVCRPCVAETVRILEDILLGPGHC